MPLTIVQPGVGGTGSSTASSTGSGAAVLATQPSFPSTIGVGGATASTSGAGITFPATQSASTDANTLDDYEEGTWTAAITTGGIASQSCNYTKIGRMVTITGNVIYNGASVTPDLTGVPFTSANTHDIAVTIYSSGMEVSAGGPIIGFLGKNNTKIFFYSWVNNSLGSAYQSSGEIIFTCTYFV